MSRAAVLVNIFAVDIEIHMREYLTGKKNTRLCIDLTSGSTCFSQIVATVGLWVASTTIDPHQPPPQVGVGCTTNQLLCNHFRLSREGIPTAEGRVLPSPCYSSPQRRGPSRDAQLGQLHWDRTMVGAHHSLTTHIRKTWHILGNVRETTARVRWARKSASSPILGTINRGGDSVSPMVNPYGLLLRNDYIPTMAGHNR